MTNKERDRKRKVGTQRHDEALHSSEAPLQTVDDTKSGAQEHRVMSVQKDFFFLREMPHSFYLPREQLLIKTTFTKRHELFIFSFCSCAEKSHGT